MAARVPALTQRRLHVHLTTALGVAAMLAASPTHANAQPVRLDVHVTVTDLNNTPLPDNPVRLVFGSTPGWKSPDAGTRFVTDASGEYRFTTGVALEERRVKRPTNFVSSLLSGKERVQHLLVAAEMPYMQFRWLYVFEIDRFESDATCMMTGFTMFARDAHGAFTVEATRDKIGGWSLPELKGRMLSRAAYEPSDFTLQPASSNAGETRWTLHVTFKKVPDAVQR